MPKPPNGIHHTDLALMKRLMTFYGPHVALRAFATLCDDQAVQIAKTHASEAKRWLAIVALLEQIADDFEELE